MRWPCFVMASTAALLSAPASAKPAEPACEASRLSVEITDPGGGAGINAFTVVLTNKSKSSCSLSGFPHIVAKAENGKTVEIINAKDIYAVAEQPLPSPRVVLKPTQKAQFQVHYLNGTGLDDLSRCVVVRNLELHIPRDKQSIAIPVRAVPCGGMSITSFRNPW